MQVSIGDGEIIYRDRYFTRVDQGAILGALRDSMRRALSHNEMRRRDMSQTLMPHVRAFYRGGGRVAKLAAFASAPAGGLWYPLSAFAACSRTRRRVLP